MYSCCLQLQVNIMGALTFLCLSFNNFFLKVNHGLHIVLSMRGKILIPMYRLVWTTWTPMSAVPQKAVKLNHSLTHSHITDASSQVWGAKLGSQSLQGTWLLQQASQQIKLFEMEAMLLDVTRFMPWIKSWVVCQHRGVQDQIIQTDPPHNSACLVLWA